MNSDVPANSRNMDPVGDSIRALSTAGYEDPADCGVAQGVIEIRRTILVSAGEKANPLEHMFPEVDLESPTLEDAGEPND